MEISIGTLEGLPALAEWLHEIILPVKPGFTHRAPDPLEIPWCVGWAHARHHGHRGRPGRPRPRVRRLADDGRGAAALGHVHPRAALPRRRRPGREGCAHRDGLPPWRAHGERVRVYRPPTSVGMRVVDAPWFFERLGGGWHFFRTRAAARSRAGNTTSCAAPRSSGRSPRGWARASSDATSTAASRGSRPDASIQWSSRRRDGVSTRSERGGGARRSGAHRPTRSRAPGDWSIAGARMMVGLRRGLAVALRQHPARPQEVAGVAVRVRLQVVLVLGLGLPERAGGLDRRSRPCPATGPRRRRPRSCRGRPLLLGESGKIAER